MLAVNEGGVQSGPRSPAATGRLSSELIICTRNRADALGDCLASVRQSRLVPERVLVVDSSDDDATEQLVVKAAAEGVVDLLYVRGPRGLTLQRNLGMSLLRPDTDVVHFVDDDVVVEDGYFEAIIEAFAADERVVGVGGKITNVPRPRLTRLRAWMMLGGRQGTVVPSGHNIMMTDFTVDTPVEWLSGCAMSHRVNRVRGLAFDERRTGYGMGEDVDFSMRAAERGSLVWTPSARLEHRQGDRGPDYYFVMSRAGVKHRWTLGCDRLGRVRRVWVVYGTVAWSMHGALVALARGDLRPSAVLGQRTSRQRSSLLPRDFTRLRMVGARSRAFR